MGGAGCDDMGRDTDGEEMAMGGTGGDEMWRGTGGRLGLIREGMR